MSTGSGVEAIGDYAFTRSGLTSVNIPGSVIYIGEGAFWECTALTAVTLNSGLEGIGAGAFAGCTALTTVTVPDGVVYIGDGAFWECASLATVIFSGDAPEMDEEAFYGVTATVTYPAGNATWTEDILQDYGGTLTWRMIIAAPAVTVELNDDGKPYVEWTAVNGATQYDIYRAEGAGEYTLIKSTAELFVNDSDAGIGKTYSYKVQAYRSGELSPFSEPASIYVPRRLMILGQPVSAAVTVGKTAVFAVNAEGEGLGYLWQYRANANSEWKTYSSTVGTSLSVSALSYRNGYQYRCVITDQYGKTMTSDAATLTVKAAMAITKQPVSVTVDVDKTATFTVTATGEGLTYLWQYRANANSEWKTYSSTVGASLSVAGKTYRNGYQYRCVITDAEKNTVTSTAATLTVKAKAVLAITEQPVSATVDVDKTATFTVTATGEGLTYLWQYRANANSEWKTYGSTVGGSLSVVGKSYRNGYQYRCVVTDGSGNTVTSTAATLTVR